MPSLESLTLLLLSSLSALQILRLVTLRPRERVTPPSGTNRLRHWLVLGTDADLRVELAFLLYLVAARTAAELSSLGEESKLDPFLVLTAFLAGFHFRQWLSQWRIRNIVSFKRLVSNRHLVFSLRRTTSFVLSNVVICYLLSRSPAYGVACFLGLIAHEVSSEHRKSSQLLRRRLHLCDIPEFSSDRQLTKLVLGAVSAQGLSRLAREAELQAGKKRLVLLGFRYFLKGDQNSFRELVVASKNEILLDADLCYYFGRALYSFGLLDTAEELLEAGHRLGDGRCSSYFALTMHAKSQISGVESPTEPKEILGEVLRSNMSDRKSRILANAFSAQLNATLAGKFPNVDRRICEEAYGQIHEAIRLNEAELAFGSHGSISYAYYRGVELMLLDICGFLMSRFGEQRLAFRVLESAINADNTFPWPYFHIALIYEDFGKQDLARSLLTRILENEQSNSVLAQLIRRRLHRSASISTSILPGDSA